MKLTITARRRDDFDVIVNSEELHKTKQSIFKVNITNADLHELTENRVEKDHLIEFAFNMKTISHYFPEFPKAVKSWVDENAE